MLVKFPSAGGWSVQRFDGIVPPWVYARINGGTAFVVPESEQEIETAMLAKAEHEQTGGRAIKPAAKARIEPKNFIRPTSHMWGDAIACVSKAAGKAIPKFLR